MRSNLYTTPYLQSPVYILTDNVWGSFEWILHNKGIYSFFHQVTLKEFNKEEEFIINQPVTTIFKLIAKGKIEKALEVLADTYTETVDKYIAEKFSNIINKEVTSISSSKTKTSFRVDNVNDLNQLTVRINCSTKNCKNGHRIYLIY